MIELGEAWEDILASKTLEMVATQMFSESGLIRAIKVTAGLHAVLVTYESLSTFFVSTRISFRG